MGKVIRKRNPVTGLEYQTVTLTLSDGRVGTFTGPVLVSREDEKKHLFVTKEQFSYPKPLPAGASFGKIGK